MLLEEYLNLKEIVRSALHSSMWINFCPTNYLKKMKYIYYVDYS